ncbi:MAG: hypothetical protein HQ515_07665 [Phycisphaeraceae bacterium]|nr:hypothetical protein [Phycisphaeraceae bacterium]
MLESTTFGNVLTCFLIAVVVFHVAMFLLRSRPKFWKVIDYLWLAVATLGLLGATSTARKILVEESVFYSERHNHSIQVYLTYKWAESAAHHFRTWEFDENPPPGGDTVMRTRISEAADWFQEVAQIVRTNPSKRAWEARADGYKSIVHENDPPGNWRSLIENYGEMLTQDLNDLHDAEEKLEAQLGKTQLTSTEQILSILAPWAIAIALAIRFTKTTATLWGYTK